MGRFDRLSRWSDALWALGVVALSLWVYRSIRGAYFSPDDLILLERAHGLIPRLSTAWRFLSGRAYFDVVTPWFGVDPRPYMTANWLIHGACVALLYAWARRHGDRFSAVAAAALFGASRLFFSVVAEVVGVGEMLALAFTLAASLALSARSPWARRAGLALFVAALFSKESVALVPLALLLSPAVGATVRERAQRVAPLVVASAVVTLYLLLTGIRSTAFAGRPYEAAFGANLVPALVLYAGWSLDLESFTPDFYGAKTPVPWAWGVGLMLVCVVGAWVARRRTRAPAVGIAWWFLGLVPVLPLLWQRYLNYLYTPSAGLALALGGLAGAAIARAPKPVRAPSPRSAKGKVPRRAAGGRWVSVVLAWGVLLALLVCYARLSESLLRARQASRLPYVDIPVDPVVRKMELARRVATRVQAAIDGRHARALFYIPEVGDRNQFFAELMESVLDHGRGLRAVCPNLDSVAFTSHWTSGYRDFDLFAGSVDGLVDALGRGPDAHLALAAKLMRFRLPHDADEHLAAASIAFPRDPRLPLARARVAVQLGERDEAISECHKALERAPTGAIADSAREMMRRLDGAAERD